MNRRDFIRSALASIGTALLTPIAARLPVADDGETPEQILQNDGFDFSEDFGSWYSGDMGDTWKLIIYATDIADLGNGRFIMAGSDGNIWISDDFGLSWHEQNAYWFRAGWGTGIGIMNGIKHG